MMRQADVILLKSVGCMVFFPYMTSAFDQLSIMLRFSFELTQNLNFVTVVLA